MMSLYNNIIQIVDDDIFYRAYLQRLLSELGFKHISLYKNSFECLYNLCEEPTVIFLDLEIDGYFGIDVLNKIKRFNQEIFVVMLLSEDDAHRYGTDLTANAFDYILKGQNDKEKVRLIAENIFNQKKTITGSKDNTKAFS